MTKILNWWRKLNAWERIAIITIPIAILLITMMCLSVDWAEFKTTEEDYVALGQVANEIVETKDLLQPLSEKLVHYNIYVESDGTIEIKLFGTAESLVVQLTEQFEIKKMYRGPSNVVPTVIFAIFLLIGLSWFISAILYGGYVVIKKIYLLFKK